MWLRSPESYSLVGSQKHNTLEILAFYSHFQVTSGQMTSLPGHLRWRGYVTTFPVTWHPPPVSYSLVESQTHQIFELSAFYSHFQVISSQISISGPLRSLRSRDVISWHVTTPSNYSLVGSQKHQKLEFLAFYSHFQVTSGQTSLPSHFQSREVMTSFPVMWVSCCELQPCGKLKDQTRVFGLPKHLPGDFRSNDVTSSPWGHVTSFPVMWLVPPASYSLVESQTRKILEFSAFYSHFQVTSDQMTSLLGQLRTCEVMWHHFLSSDWLQRVTALWEVNRTKDPVFNLLQLPGNFRSNDVTFGSLPVTWRHVTSTPVVGLLPPASYTLVKSQTHQTVRLFGLQPLPGNFRSIDFTSGSLPVTWGHVTSFRVMWLPPPASYSLVGCQSCQRHEFGSQQPHTVEFWWNHVTSGYLPGTWS